MPTTKSLWVDTAPAVTYPSLAGDTQADVVVVGAGIAGLCAAYQIAQRGLRVVVLEANRIGLGVTGYTTAKVTSAHGMIYKDLGSHAAVYAEANQWGVEWIASQGIACDFERKAMLVYAETPEQKGDLEEELKAAQHAGLPVEWTSEMDLPIPILGAIRYREQLQFHPNRFLQGLAERIVAAGGEIFERTRAIDFHEDEPCRIRTDHGTVTARKMVIASHYPAYDPAGYFSRLAPYRDYAVAVRINGQLPHQMSISAGDSYAFRTQGDLLIVSGGHHKVGQADTDAQFAELEGYVRRTFDVVDMPYRWSTQDNYTLDRMPYIGRISPGSKHTFVVTGFRAWGMSTGAYAGRIVADLITETQNPWADTFDPNRVGGIEGVTTFVKENANVARHLVGDKFSDMTDLSVADLKPSQAAIVKHRGEKVGAYRDAAGNVHLVHPICTHMGCDLAWNSAERSWDCPCHGSRFTHRGQVIQGPATKDLKIVVG